MADYLYCSFEQMWESLPSYTIQTVIIDFQAQLAV